MTTVSNTCGVCASIYIHIYTYIYSTPVLIELVYEDDEAPRDVVVFKRQSRYLEDKKNKRT
jgi:hypothetical protein